MNKAKTRLIVVIPAVFGASLLSACNSGSGNELPLQENGIEIPQIASAKASLTSDMPLGTTLLQNWTHPDAEVAYDYDYRHNPDIAEIAATHFNQVVSEGQMKPRFLHPHQDEFHFAEADDLVAWAETNGLSVHGHTLLWHVETPQWLHEFVGNREQWLDVMDEHITTIVQRYAGRIISWDVVNEGILSVWERDELAEGEFPWRDTVWFRGVGDDYIAKAFEYAHAADPDAELYYNDYWLMYNETKLDAVLEMVDSLLADDVPIHGIGFQLHTDIRLTNQGIDTLRQALRRVVSRGLKVRFSELDVYLNVNRKRMVFTGSIAEKQKQLYYQIVRTYLEEVPPAQRGGITVWGITDRLSWSNLNGISVKPGDDAYDWPLLFNHKLEAKPALAGVVQAIEAYQ